MTALIGTGVVYQPNLIAARRRLAAWSKMTSKQKLADMLREDRRRKRGRGRK